MIWARSNSGTKRLRRAAGGWALRAPSRVDRTRRSVANTMVNAAAVPLLDAALALPEDGRASLALRLLESLDEGEDADAEHEWNDELAARARAVEAGHVTGVAGDEAMAIARAALRGAR